MKKEKKEEIILSLTEDLKNFNNFYITDISALNAEVTSQLRRLCFKKQIRLKVAKNTLLKKAMEKSGKDFSALYGVLKENTALMFCENATEPAKLIKEFRKKYDKPILKAAYVMDTIFIGDNQLDNLISLKSKEELIGEIIGTLQSPIRNLLSALQSGGNKIAGILETLSKKE